MRVAFLTLGCKVNQYETQAMINRFINAGYEISDFAEKADVYVVNTCTVTAVSDKKSRQALRRCKKINPQAIVVAAGCFTQMSSKEVASIPDVDIILGASHKDQVLSLVAKALSEKKKLCAVSDIMTETTFEEFGSADSFEHTRAYIKIQDGCDNYCSYCIIPYARGHARSRDIENIGLEFDALYKNGFQEVILTGIEISTYRNGNIGIIELLEFLNEKNTIPRIRLGSLEPRLVTSEFVSRLAKLSRLCPQFHLALQSGCDSVLRRMNRKYTTNQFKKAVELLQIIPNVSITTDIITGFPGETEEEFNDTLSFVKSIDFLKLHIFPYSRRAGTIADQMPGQIEKKLKTARSKQLDQLGNQLRAAYLEKQIGKTMPVLFEHELDKNLYCGFTPNYIPVTVRSERKLSNVILPVLLKTIHGDGYIGEIR